jgi:hypothetical protein
MTTQQPRVQQLQTNCRQQLGLQKFSVKIPKLKLFSQQLRGLVIKAMTQQPKSTRFQDPQAAAETSGN